MTKNTPGGTKKHRESAKPESRQTAKMLLLLFFFFRRASSNLRDFPSGFHTKQQHFPLSSAPAHCFLACLKSHEVVRTTH